MKDDASVLHRIEQRLYEPTEERDNTHCWRCPVAVTQSQAQKSLALLDEVLCEQHVAVLLGADGEATYRRNYGR